MFGDTKVETLSKQTEGIKLSEIMRTIIIKTYLITINILYTEKYQISSF